MLLELRVENYAVIDNIAVEFAPGLNLLTGETGAGKSILIDALALLLGERASADVIRHGAEKAVVSCVFESESRVQEILEQNGIDSSNGPIIVRREVGSSGKGRVFINNQPATVAVLRQLAPILAAVHAQNQSILAFDAAARLELLDSFAGSHPDFTRAAYDCWRSLHDHIAELERDEHDRSRLVDLWSFQRKEIEQARLQAGEDERLETEKRLLANLEKIYSAAMSGYDALYDGANSAATSVRAAVRHLEELARYDSRFHEQVAALQSARLVLEDVGTMLRDYVGGINPSPERLAEIEDRLALIDRLKRKYGQTVGEIIAFGEEVARKLNALDHCDASLHQLRQQLAATREKYLASARALSHARTLAAQHLEKRVEAEIQDLAMTGSFRIEITSNEEEASWSGSGFDRVAYLIATNPGEPLRPVEQIASGGELSRVMLALKVSVEPDSERKKSAVLRTLVFDEIDTGIGGRAAEAVGKKLKALARRHQVLCITHLPQIASFADRHFVLEKGQVNGRSQTIARPLDAAARKEELARMISGAQLTDSSRKHAAQMLKNHR